MIIEAKICPECHEEFKPNHGNRIFCGYDCYDQYKKIKQKENDELMKQCRKGFIKNYRLFRELLPEAGTITISLWNLLKAGFDQDAYYGVMVGKGKQWQKVNEYLFNVEKKDGQQILTLTKS